MERAKPNLLYFVSGAAFLLSVLSAALFFLFSDVIFFGASMKAPAISFSLSENKEVIFDSENSVPLGAGEHTFLLSNSESERLFFSFLAEGEMLAEAEVAPKSEKEICLHLSSSAPLSVLISGKKASLAYLSDAASFLAVLPNMEAGSAIFQRKTDLGILSIEAPISLYGDFSFEEMNLETKKEAKIVFSSEREFSSPIYLFAPNARLYLKGTTPDCDEEVINYYIKAKSINHKKLFAEKFPIENFDALSRLADKARLPHFTDGAEISFLASFAMEESLIFSGHAALDFLYPIDFNGKTISFLALGAGEFRVKTALSASVDSASLLFDAPRSALIWESEGAKPAVETIESQNNLLSYNGKKTSLGGEGKAIPEIVFPAESNSSLSDDARFAVQGNLLAGVLPFSVSQTDLDSFSYRILCPNGDFELLGSLSDGVIRTTDESGKTRDFAIAILREKKSIPTVQIKTENGAEIASKTEYVSATFSMDAEGTGYSSQNEVPIRIRGRGNSTWKWEKKPYKIHFDEKTSLFGLPEAEEWALMANFADKSLMRNRLGQALASKLSFSYQPSHIYVDVFLNGEYMGVYTLGEHLEEGEGRVEIEHNMDSADCGFFLEAGGVVAGVDKKGLNYFHAGLTKFVLIKSPEYETLTREQFDFIESYMKKADAAIKSSDGYEEYLDLESVIDWLIITELSYNTDCSWRRSTYFTKNPGEKLLMGPVWDFDLAFGNFSKDNAGYDTWVSSEPEDDYIGTTWTTYLLEDPKFRAKFKARWEEVAEELLAAANDLIDADFALLLPSATENFDRWDILGKKVAFEPKKTEQYKTYSSQIYYLKNFVAERAEWISAQVAEW